MNTLESTNLNPSRNLGKRVLSKGLAILAISAATGPLSAQTLCEAGYAGAHPCKGIDLMSVRAWDELGGSGGFGNGNDCWGWVKEEREFVLYGRSNGLAVVEVTDPVNPVYLANLPTHSSPSLWRDVKVYNNHAFIVSEAGGHGMQVLDLNVAIAGGGGQALQMLETAHFDGFGHAHNIAMNESTGYAYPVGTNEASGGLLMINVQDPLNPVLEGSWNGNYVHDAQVVVFDGEDQNYVGREIAFLSGGYGGFYIVDVTDKTDPQTLSSFTSSDFVYTHQSWLTEDHRYMFICDEIDEINNGGNTRTYIVDLLDLENPVQLGFYSGTLEVTDHNIYTHKGLAFSSNYNAGLQVLRPLNLQAAEMEEVAYFDTEPSTNEVGTDGAWSVYPYFPSGTIAISTFTHLFVVRPSEDSVLDVALAAVPDDGLAVFAGDDALQLDWDGASAAIEVFSVSGQLMYAGKLPHGRSAVSTSGWATGLYLVSCDQTGTARRVVVR